MDVANASGKLLQLRELWDTMVSIGPYNYYGSFVDGSKMYIALSEATILPAAKVFLRWLSC